MFKVTDLASLRLETTNDVSNLKEAKSVTTDDV